MRYYKILMGVSVALILAFAGYGWAQAYVAYPEKWSTNSVTYDNSALSSGWRSAVADGATQWNNVTPSPFTFNSTTSSSNTNDVFLGNIDGQYGAYAQTHTYFPGGQTITRFTLQFDSGETWTGGLSAPSSTQLDSVSVAAHELGHAFGLGHTDWWRCAFWVNIFDRPTMCDSYDYGRVDFRYLEQDDKDGINYKYP